MTQEPSPIFAEAVLLLMRIIGIEAGERSMTIANGDDKRMQRWRLALGLEGGACIGPGLNGGDARLDAALEAIYGYSSG